VGILVIGLVFYSYTYGWLPADRPDLARWRVALHGLVFGGLAVILMVARIEISPGVFIDARVVPVALIGLFEGWPAALLAAAVAAAYRSWLGGSGLWAGVTTLVLTALAAGAVRGWTRRSGRLGTSHAVVLSGIIYLIIFGAFAMLGEHGMRLFAPIWWAYPPMLLAGIAGLAKLFHNVSQQHALTAAQQRYRAIMDEAIDVIRILDPDTLRILETNRADSELSGYTREEILKLTARDFWPDDPAVRVQREAGLAEVLARGHQHAPGVGYRTRAGHVMLVDATYRYLAYQGQGYLITIFHDAAPRLAAETAQRETAELRAVTLLARAAAHEIHNPLAVIMGYLQLLKPAVAHDEKASGWIPRVLEASGRIREAVDRLTRLIRIESASLSGAPPAMLDTRKSTTEATAAPSAPPPPAAARLDRAPPSAP